MNKVGFNILYNISDYLLLEIIHVFVTVKAWPVTKVLLITITEHKRFPIFIDLVPKMGFCFRDFRKESLIRHSVPLNISIRFHAIFMSNSNCLCNSVHIVLFSLESETFITANVEHSDPRFCKSPDVWFGKLIIIILFLPLIKVRIITAYLEDPWLVSGSGIRKSTSYPYRCIFGQVSSICLG